MDNNELMHYGVLGMKWGKRKAYDPTSRGGSITRNGKYRASNGMVVARSKNAGAAIGRRLTTSAAGGALGAFGSIGMNKNQKSRIKRERDALKEYHKVGGDKMLDDYKKDLRLRKRYLRLRKRYPPLIRQNAPRRFRVTMNSFLRPNGMLRGSQPERMLQSVSFLVLVGLRLTTWQDLWVTAAVSPPSEHS